jgi:UDP-N-acetyl-D-mannosaminuronic acid transferase (WecB/TagA/CpsF family)
VSKKKKRKPAGGALLGIGLDNEDGHKRVTTGEQFAIVGGSAETHEKMTETVVKTFEELKSRGKHLQEVERKELAEIIKKSEPR